MLDQTTRLAILKLHEQGQSVRAIARALRLSRGAIGQVVRSGSAEVPPITRQEKAEPYRDEIVELYARCKGNLVRVHEELVAAGAELSYQGLTAFCRRHDLGRPPREPAGRYPFAPGQEMQHDTSPHDLVLGGKRRRVQTASVVLCYSRMRFIQVYPTFNRFLCKVFLTEAVRYFGGACTTCMIDNTHVIVLRGTGAEMVPVPEMEAFAERYGFAFRAHEKGDANRSAHVERGFDHFDNNFLAGREFADWDDLNQRARAWCDQDNARLRRHLHASPRELLVAEGPQLRPLPLWVPEVYALHHRTVDLEGYVSVQSNRYSAPYRLIGRRVEIRETWRTVEIFEGPRQVASHVRTVDASGARITQAEHRPPRGQRRAVRNRCPEQERIVRTAPELGDYVEALKRRAHGRGTLALRRLARMLDEYPREALRAAVEQAARYRMFDLERLERMVLRAVAHDFFPHATDGEHDPEGGP